VGGRCIIVTRSEKVGKFSNFFRSSEKLDASTGPYKPLPWQSAVLNRWKASTGTLSCSEDLTCAINSAMMPVFQLACRHLVEPDMSGNRDGKVPADRRPSLLPEKWQRGLEDDIIIHFSRKDSGSNGIVAA